MISAHARDKVAKNVFLDEVQSLFLFDTDANQRFDMNGSEFVPEYQYMPSPYEEFKSRDRYNVELILILCTITSLLQVQWEFTLEGVF